MKLTRRRSRGETFLRSAAETEEELAVAIGTGDGGIDGAEQRGAAQQAEGERADVVEYGLLHRGVADDAAAFVDFGFAGFELRFHEGDQYAAGAHKRPDGGENNFEGNEGEVGDDGVELITREIADGEMSGVDFFEIGDAGISEEFGVQLGAADIDADDICGAGLQGAIGEAAGGGADVEDVRAGEIEGERGEGGGKFFAAAADEARGLLHGEFAIGGEIAAGFVEALGAAADAAGHDEGFGLGAGRGEAARNEEFVEADFFCGSGHAGAQAPMAERKARARIV